MGPILCCVSVRLMITAVKAKTLFHIIKNIKQIGQIKVLFPEIQIKGLSLRIYLFLVTCAHYCAYSDQTCFVL